jgi:protein-disulfide isomerase
MKRLFEVGMNAILAMAAVSIAASVVKRDFLSTDVRGALPTAPKAVRLDDWETLASSGIWIGPADAPVTVVVFGDLECPFCRRFDETLRKVQSARPGTVSQLFLHYPLPHHRFALPAARALECAALEGRAAQMLHTIYDKQDSLGLKTWSDYAESAGLDRLGAFDDCVSDSGSFERIDLGQSEGERIGVHATPTVIINGWWLSAAPDSVKLSDIVDDLLAGKKPRYR